MRPTLWQALIVACVLGGLCCGGPTTPSASLSVSSVTPVSGTTLGGTVVTISGTDFAAGATVTIGGVAAVNVVVAGPASITATTAQRASGLVDVVVASGGRTATLPNGFTYAAPSAAVNAPPVIASLFARGSRPNEPGQFADLDEIVDVQAIVSDAETPPSQLTYEWSSSLGGTFTGGASATWHAPPNASTPAVAALTLTVTEKYMTVDPSGLPVERENRVSQSTSVSLHNSRAEIGDMARQFLLDFSNPGVRDVNTIMRNFTDLCPAGKAAETSEVAHNRDHFTIKSAHVDTAAVTVNFSGACPFRARSADACAEVPVDWASTFLDDGSLHHAVGTDQVTAVYDAAKAQWALCESDFDGSEVITGKMRGFLR
jgi:hypothetical protein